MICYRATLPTIYLLFWLSAPTAAQDHHRTLLQDQQLRLNLAELRADDVDDPTWAVDLEPAVTIEAFPTHGDLFVSGADLTYIPDRRFFGTDRFSYSWNGPSGPITGTVELLVVPWITPFSGRFDLPSLPGEEPLDGVGYYNSHSGTFYFCITEPVAPLWLSATRDLPCLAYRYPGFRRGWLPLVGNWQGPRGEVLSNRPGLYDSASRTVLLLDEDTSAPCWTCSDEIPALSLAVIDRFQLEEPASATSPMIPLALDLDRDGVDSILFFHPGERRFVDVPGWPSLATTLPGSVLWPITVSDEEGFDEPAVFDRPNGQLDLVISSTRLGLGWGPEHLAIARRDETGGILYRLYDPAEHGLTAFLEIGSDADTPCVISGTQILRFPSDPDPPPHGGAGVPSESPTEDPLSGVLPCG